MHGGCVGDLCCLAFLLSIALSVSQDLNPADTNAFHEENATQSERFSSEQLPSVEHREILKVTEQVPTRTKNTEIDFSNQLLSGDRNGNPQETNDEQELEPTDKFDNVKNPHDLSLEQSGEIEEKSSNQRLPYEQWNNAPQRNDKHYSSYKPAADFSNIASDARYEPVLKQSGPSPALIESNGRFDVGNIQLPIFRQQTQTNEPTHQSYFENVPIANLPDAYSNSAQFESTIQNDLVHAEITNKIRNSNTYPYNIGQRNDIQDNRLAQSNAGYILSPHEMDDLIQAIIQDKSHISSTDTLVAKQQDLHRVPQIPAGPSLDNYQGHYPHTRPGQKRPVASLKYYLRSVHENELIYLKNIPGVENLIKCSREGEFYNLLTPSKECLVCACVQQIGTLQAVCTSCLRCAPAELTPAPRPAPPDPLASACAPLPVGVAFEHPLNPCHICICYIVENNKTHISCQDDSRCSKPLVIPPPKPDAITSVAPHYCERFPYEVEFPHPTDRCQRCKCLKEEAFSANQYHMQCHYDCESGITGTSPGPLEPLIKPADILIFPTKPESGPSNYPSPFKHITPKSIIKPPPFFPGQQILLPIKSIGREQLYPTYPQKPPPFTAIQLDHIIPLLPPTPVTPTYYPYPFSSTESPIPVLVPVPSGPSKPKPDQNFAPLPWPPKVAGRPKGPLLGPPPHESCAPYPAEAEFQHPWDECQVCRCNEFRSSGHISIEVNCYTKYSCCVEIPTSSDSSQLITVGKEQLQTLDKICEYKTFEVEFVDSGSCRVCACRVVGTFVIPVCGRRAPPAIAHQLPQCAQLTVSHIDVVYIEPQCRMYAPSQPFRAGCNVCVCLAVFNYVVASCTPEPNCDSSQGLNVNSLNLPNGAVGVAYQQRRGSQQWGDVQSTDYKAKEADLKLNIRTNSIDGLHTSAGVAGQHFDSGLVYSAPSYYGRPQAGEQLSSVQYSTARLPAAAAQYYGGYVGGQMAQAQASSSSQQQQAYLKMSKSGEEAGTAPSVELTADNAYPFRGEESGPSARASDASNTEAPAQLPAGVTGPATRAGRGQCQFAGDMYHARCQACYCFEDARQDLYSLCTGHPCSP